DKRRYSSQLVGFKKPSHLLRITHSRLQNATCPLTSKRQYRPFAQSGLSLSELLVVVAIMALLTLYATPLIAQQLQRHEPPKVERIVRQLVAEGRSFAFAVRQRVIICGSNDAQQCDETAWSSGMLMYMDKDRNNQFDPTIDHLIRYESLRLKYGQFNWIGGITSKHQVRFEHTTGMPHGSFGSFHYCDFKQSHLFRIAVRNTGVARVTTQDVRC
ncbi:MAG: prepilin-type N-terminal cleavage/methylation domain-containing protein, partial [Pseudomonadota bacterium]|nr:prepilin-type N-terminal cleavage/methylation domain-containing protein [Pseudomonadota bacterium]